MTSAAYSLSFKVIRFQAPVSSGECSGKFSGRPFDVWAVKRVLPDQWRALLRSYFRNHIEVAYAFSVDEKTARNWWEGVGCPRSEIALAAIRNIPHAAKILGAAA